MYTGNTTATLAGNKDREQSGARLPPTTVTAAEEGDKIWVSSEISAPDPCWSCHSGSVLDLSVLWNQISSSVHSFSRRLLECGCVGSLCVDVLLDCTLLNHHKSSISSLYGLICLDFTVLQLKLIAEQILISCIMH